MLAGERLAEAEALAPLRGHATWPRWARSPTTCARPRHGDLTFYNRNVHLNPTNVCVATCKFCSFARPDDKHASEGYTMSLDQAVEHVVSKRALGITEVHIVSGLHPDLPWEYYLETVRRIRAGLARAAHQGLHRGGAALLRREVREDPRAGAARARRGRPHHHPRRRRRDLRRRGCAGRSATTRPPPTQWLEVHRTAHRLGIKSNATMLYGHIETLAERVDHMARLRELQDETHGFQVFIPLAFHPEHNMIGKAFPKPTGYDGLRTFAVARLFLDNFDHVKAYWVSLGERLAQASLSFGVDDVDGTVLEERIYHMAGATDAAGALRGPAPPADPLRRPRARPSATASTTCSGSTTPPAGAPPPRPP